MDNPQTGFAVVDETKALAEPLTKFAGKSVAIEVRVGTETHNLGSDARNAVKVVINSGTLDKVRQEDHKKVVLRGLAYHQLLGGLYPAEDQQRTATKDGFGALFVVVNDEQNERKAMAKDPTLGAAFQTVCAYVFSKKNRSRGDVLAVGATVTKGDKDAETYTQRVNEFAFHFRRHLPADDKTDATVKEALGLIPEGLKDLSKAELLTLSRQIHDRLVRGVTLVKPVFFDPIGKVQEKEPTAKTDGEVQPEDLFNPDEAELATLSPANRRWWQLVLKSKWSFVALGTFTVAWMLLGLSFGLGFWRVIAYGAIGIAAVAGLLTVVLSAFSFSGRDGDSEPDDDCNEPKAKGKFWSNLWKGICNFFPFDIKFKGFGEWGASIARCWCGFWRGVWGLVCWCAGGLLSAGCSIGEELEKCWRTPLARHLRNSVANFCSNSRNWVVRTAIIVWRSPTMRIAIVALPIAGMFLLAMAVMVGGAELVLWKLILVIVGWLTMVGLAYVFRKKLISFLVADIHNDEKVEHDVECSLPKDTKTRTFSPIRSFVPVDADPKFIETHRDEIEKAAARLAQSIQRVGVGTKENDYQLVGVDLIEDLELALLGETALCVDEEAQPKLALNGQFMVDCSQSTNDPTAKLKRGEKHVRAKKFALMAERAFGGKRGVSSRSWGFNDTVIYDCGANGQGRSSGLKVHGGNNDAAALQHASQIAGGTNAAVKVLVLISDDQPADCSWGALNDLGLRLVGQGFIVVQVLTDKTDKPALPWNTINLHDNTLEEAAAEFGIILERCLAPTGSQS